MAQKKTATKKPGVAKPASKKGVKKVAAPKAAPKKPVAKKPSGGKAVTRPPAPKSHAKGKAGKAAAPVAVQAEPASPLNKRERESLRHALVEARERLSGQITSLKNESLTRNDEVNVEEDGTDAFDRQFALTLASTENEAIFEIDDALRRLDAGEYGKCEECSGGIERARLKAIPFVRTCIRCQSEIEKKRPGYRPNGRV